jgi:hypothetical protein
MIFDNFVTLWTTFHHGVKGFQMTTGVCAKRGNKVRRPSAPKKNPPGSHTITFIVITRPILLRLPSNHLLLSVYYYYKGPCIIGTGENAPGGAALREKVCKISDK